MASSLFTFFKRKEASQEERSLNVENPSVSLAEIFNIDVTSSAGEQVTTKSALTVPAIWAAVNFLSSTIATLPLNLYQKTKDGGRQKLDGDKLQKIIHDSPNPEWTSYRWRKYAMTCTLLDGGRSFTWIQRTKAGKVIKLVPLVPKFVEVNMLETGEIVYEYRTSETGPARRLKSIDVIDIPFLLESDQVTHINPIGRLKRTIGLTIALESYAARHFENGGVPPLSLEGPINSPASAERAGKDIYAALKKAKSEGRNILPLPIGHTLKPVGFNPEQSQLESARRFQVEEVARIYNLPPTFLQDMSKATFSNSEQQDLHFVKHTLAQWLMVWEQELNLKILRTESSDKYIEFNVDGLLRGDFATRMDGLAKGIQNGFLTPNEARAMENRSAKEGGDDLLLQQNMISLGNLNDLVNNKNGNTDGQ